MHWFFLYPWHRLVIPLLPTFSVAHLKIDMGPHLLPLNSGVLHFISFLLSPLLFVTISLSHSFQDVSFGMGRQKIPSPISSPPSSSIFCWSMYFWVVSPPPIFVLVVDLVNGPLSANFECIFSVLPLQACYFFFPKTPEVCPSTPSFFFW